MGWIAHKAVGRSAHGLWEMGSAKRNQGGGKAAIATVSAVKTETSEQKNFSNIFFFPENILFNTIEYI